jgi:hypothetical protein
MKIMDQFYRKSDPSKKAVYIKEDAGNFYELSDNNMIKKEDLTRFYDKVNEINMSTQSPNTPLNPNTLSDTVDPNAFFNTSSVDNKLYEQLNNINTANVPDVKMPPELKHNIPTNQVKSVPNAPQTNMATNQMVQPNPLDNSIVKQASPDDFDFKKQEIIDMYNDEVIAFGEQEATLRRDKRFMALYKNKGANTNGQIPTSDTQTMHPTTNPMQSMDPVEMMFKSFKRNHDIEISLNFKNKIANPDFVKMMMENMEGDIVEYYKSLIMKDILSDMSVVEEEVKKCIQKEIYGDEYEEIVKKLEKEEAEKEKESTVNEIEPTIEPTSSDTTMDVVVLDEKNDTNAIVIDLIKGKITSTGKQTYLYVDDNDNIKEVLPETAEKKGYKPYVEKIDVKDG